MRCALLDVHVTHLQPERNPLKPLKPQSYEEGIVPYLMLIGDS